MDGVSLTGVGMEVVLAHTCGTVCSQIIIWYRCHVGTVFLFYLLACVLQGGLMVFSPYLDLFQLKTNSLVFFGKATWPFNKCSSIIAFVSESLLRRMVAISAVNKRWNALCLFGHACVRAVRCTYSTRRDNLCEPKLNAFF